MKQILDCMEVKNQRNGKEFWVIHFENSRERWISNIKQQLRAIEIIDNFPYMLTKISRGREQKEF